ncbi:LacI family DNA-binding transcriptional regulator [Gorillibacterium timonense]|uniref:LacI family DNA-binding transcriptional regulator n=1 Tax=Gorillibacterium timonense TaxID=1689269 RepID=UPI00071DB832|nr:LacI family DNA-binding transcriptional regulator [Gorillibacterium timonense]
MKWKADLERCADDAQTSESSRKENEQASPQPHFPDKITQQDIAARLGLSLHTVSKALRGRSGMSEQTRRAVFQTARELGYRTKQQENSLAIDRLEVQPGQSCRFLFISYAKSSLHQLLYDGLADRLAEFGHHLNWITYPDETTDEARLNAWLDEQAVPYVDGLFLSFGLPLLVEKRILQVPVPKILLNYPETGIEADSIIWDVYDAIAKSVLTFVEAGHRSILYVGDIYSHRGFRRRWQAFSETMNDAGLEVRLEDHLIRSYSTQQEWTKAFAELLTKRAPSAVLCSIEYILPWVYDACASLSLQIPGDVSLISLETILSPLSDEVTHPHLLVSKTGERAADRLLWRIANPHLPYEHIRLQCRWHDGGTVRQLHNKRKPVIRWN